MSNDIKNSDGKAVHTNINGCHMVIGDDHFLFSHILPVVLHYIKGGLFGHLISDRDGLEFAYITNRELDEIEKFISEVKVLKRKKLDNGNIGFIPERPRKKSTGHAVGKRKKCNLSPVHLLP